MKKIISGSTLKILAMIFMVIDHLGQVVLKNGIILHAPYSMFTDEQFDMLMSTVNICHILGRIELLPVKRTEKKYKIFPASS